MEFSKKGYHYHRCRSCRHVFVFPLPEPSQEAAYYEKAFSPDYLDTVRAWFEVLARRRMDLIESHFSRPVGRVLDVGCGYGQFVAEAGRRGWTARGIDSAGEPLRTGREELGIDVESADIAIGLREQPDSSWDVITFWHVLEHLSQPGEVLRTASAKLAPGGLLVANSPNLSSAIYKLAGSDWSWIYTPGHNQFFSLDSLAAFLRGLDLEMVASETWTDSPNLYFLLEEVFLLRLCDLMQAWAKVGGRMWVWQERLRTWVFSPENQQRVQMKLKAWYDRTPGLDGWLKSRRLGHELLLIAREPEVHR